jgi:hypothetical protein
MSNYTSTSPYFKTPMWGPFLDLWQPRFIQHDATDAVYQIDPIYNHRPDLLAYDMYKESAYWWVFAVRNPDVLIDPLMDFTTGKIIYVPTIATVKTSLGTK